MCGGFTGRIQLAARRVGQSEVQRAAVEEQGVPHLQVRPQQAPHELHLACTAREDKIVNARTSLQEGNKSY